MVSFDIKEAADFLKLHPESLRKMAASGEVPACKIGKSWIFIREHLVEHISGRYANQRGILRLVGNKSQETEQCHSTKDMANGTSISSMRTEKEYDNLLKLLTSNKLKSSTTNSKRKHGE